MTLLQNMLTGTTKLNHVDTLLTVTLKRKDSQVNLSITVIKLNNHGHACSDTVNTWLGCANRATSSRRRGRGSRARLKVLDPILWSTLHFSTPLRPNHRRHIFTTAATVCLGCGLSLNITCETYNLHWALRVTCTIEMFVTPSSTHVVLFIH